MIEHEIPIIAVPKPKSIRVPNDPGWNWAHKNTKQIYAYTKVEIYLV